MAKKSSVVKCPYCRKPAELVGGNVIYPHREDLYHLYFYLCPPCNSYVGCHKKTKKPLGSLANENLRNLRSQAHSAFDPIWKGKMSRSDGYSWLARNLDMDPEKCHIGLMGPKLCRKVIKLCTELEA